MKRREARSLQSVAKIEIHVSLLLPAQPLKYILLNGRGLCTVSSFQRVGVGVRMKVNVV